MAPCGNGAHDPPLGDGDLIHRAADHKAKFSTWLVSVVRHLAVDWPRGVLRPEQRVAVSMYIVDGVPAADVARVLGLPNEKTVYNLVYRALAAMRQVIERAGIAKVQYWSPAGMSEQTITTATRRGIS